MSVNKFYIDDIKDLVHKIDVFCQHENGWALTDGEWDRLREMVFDHLEPFSNGDYRNYN